MPAKGKGKAISKKLRKSPDVSKKRKEETEKNLKEEEDRLKAEVEEAEQRARDLVMKKEMKKREKDENDLIVDEIPKLNVIESHRNNTFLLNIAHHQSALEWERYLKPGQLPSPYNYVDVNVYFRNLTMENPHHDLKVHMDSCQNLINLMCEMYEVYYEEFIAPPKTDSVKWHFEEMINFLFNEMDTCTYTFTSDVVSKAKPDSDYVGNKKMDWIDISIWANITKNPRTKSFEVEEKGLFCEVTPYINRFNCCIRFVFYAFDIYFFRIHSSMEVEERELYSKESQSTKNSDIFEVQTLKSTVLDAPKTPNKQYPKIYIHDNSDEQNKDKVMDLDDLEEEEEQLLNLSMFGLESPPVSMEDLGKLKYYVSSNYVNEMKMSNVGGIFNIDLFQLPDQPKFVKNWNMQKVIVPPRMFPIEYKAEIVKKTLTKSFNILKSNMTKHENSFQNEISQDASAESMDNTPDAAKQTPIMVSFRIPSGIMFYKTPVVGMFQPETGAWLTSQVSDVLYNESSKQISFKICCFGTFAFFQDTYANMPFREFRLYPTGQPHEAKLFIEGTFINVEFTIKGDQVCLSDISDEVEVDFLNEFMTVTKLKKKMQFFGLNFFINEYTHYVMKGEDKSRLLLTRTYRQMSCVLFQTSFKNSRWNHSPSEPNKVVMQINTSSSQSPEDNSNWSLVEVTKKHAAHLKMLESDDNYSYSTVENHFHSNLYHLVMKMQPFSEEMNDTKEFCLFSVTANKLLEVTSPLLFAR